jgi:hypothetical protein
MENLFTMKELRKIETETYWDLLRSTELNYRSYPLNVGTSKMNKKQLCEHIRLLENTRYELTGNSHLVHN